MVLGLLLSSNAYAREDRSNKNIWVDEIGPVENPTKKWIYKIINYGSEQDYIFRNFINKLSKYQDKAAAG